MQASTASRDFRCRSQCDSARSSAGVPILRGPVTPRPPKGVTPAPAAPPAPPAAAPEGAAPSAAEEEKSLARGIHEELHDPFDDWGARDVLVSLAPVVASFAFKGVALNAALAFGIGWWGFLLALRVASWDARRKLVWPMIDLTGLVSFAVLRGLMRHFTYEITKWWPVIISLVFAFTFILSLLWRRPFTAHYARYPKFDRGGRGLWQGDANFRRAADITTLGWIAALSVALLLALIPILTDHWTGWHALNIIFDYVAPLVLLAAALLFQQAIGAWYRSLTAHTSAVTAPSHTPAAEYQAGRAAGSPAGATGVPTTYSSAA